MSSSLKAFISTVTDPHLNLAIEDSLLQSVSGSDHILFLYRNRDSVVIGRHQNPWVECDLRLMRSDGVLLARRQSGGGAVFHDLGNTNYSLISSRADYDEDRGFAVVLNALRDLEFDVERNERNDLVYRGRKFSGSAFRHRRAQSFQHGTLLVAADLDRLTRYLSAPIRRIAAKGTTSVRSGVVNLSEIRTDVDHELICRAIVESFVREYGAGAIEPALISESDVAEEVYHAAHELRSWEWLFAKSPDFRHELAIPPVPHAAAGQPIAAAFTVHRGVVRSVETTPAAASRRVPGDVADSTAEPVPAYVSTDSVVAALESLVGCRYESTELCRCLAGRGPRQTAARLCKMLEEEIP